MTVSHPERPQQLARFLATISEHDRTEGNPARLSRAAQVRVQTNAAFLRRAYRRDAVVAWSGVLVPSPIFHALDIVLFPLESMSGMLAPYRLARTALERAEESFYSRDTCSFVRGALGAAETGLYPTPDFFIGTSCYCGVAMKMLYNLSHQNEKPHFHIDVPEVGHHREEAVAYVVAQLKDLVAALEERFEKKMDTERLQEAINRCNLTRHYALKCRELRRHVPAVMLGREMMDYMSADGWGSEGMVSVYKALYEELQNRIAQKIRALENERCRVLWTLMRPYYSDDLLNHLEMKLGAVVAIDSFGAMLRELNPAEPYESIAGALLDMASYPRAAVKRVESDISSHHIDGIILYSHWRCEKASNCVYELSQIAERKDVPLLVLYGDCVDGRDYAPEQIRTRIEAFVELIENRKGERGNGAHRANG